MRTLILICLAAVSLGSCKKKYCYQCYWERKYVENGVRKITSEVETICDKTEKDMYEYDQVGKSFSKAGSSYQLTGCFKQE